MTPAASDVEFSAAMFNHVDADAVRSNPVLAEVGMERVYFRVSYGLILIRAGANCAVERIGR
jgi:hypothetical protein